MTYNELTNDQLTFEELSEEYLVVGNMVCVLPVMSGSYRIHKMMKYPRGRIVELPPIHPRYVKK